MSFTKWRSLVDGTEISRIPDSVVLQYQATTWAQGDATWTDDNGVADQSITGDVQAETLSDGAESLVFDGADDYGAFTPPSRLEGSSLNAWSLEFAYQTTSTGSERGTGLNNAGNSQRFLIENNVDGNFNSDDGNFVVDFLDQNANRLTFDPAVNLNDGNRHDVSIIYNDASANDADVIVDGSTQTLNVVNSGGPSSFGAWDVDWYWGGENDGGLTRPFNHGVGAIRFHDEAISQQTISGYPF